MNTKRYKYIVSTISIISALSSGVLIPWASSYAAGEEKPVAAIDEEQLVERVKQAIIEELRNGELIQEQIEIGIQNYVRKQQQARADAQLKQRERAEKLAQNIRPVSAERDHIRGNPDAEVSLVEYSDFECPYCKRFHPNAKKLVEAFGGKVNWIYRHFPLSFHNPGAQKQAEASECAKELGGNELFWKYNDMIYEKTRSGGKGFPIENLVPLATELGMDGDQFRDCLESARYADRVKEDFEEGTSIGITGTPGNVLLNNKTGKALLRPGAVPFAKMEADVKALLTDTQQ